MSMSNAQTWALKKDLGLDTKGCLDNIFATLGHALAPTSCTAWARRSRSILNRDEASLDTLDGMVRRLERVFEVIESVQSSLSVSRPTTGRPSPDKLDRLWMVRPELLLILGKCCTSPPVVAAARCFLFPTTHNDLLHPRSLALVASRVRRCA